MENKNLKIILATIIEMDKKFIEEDEIYNLTYFEKEYLKDYIDKLND